MRGIPHEDISIRRLVVLHGFTYAYNIEPIEKALPLVRKWIHEKRAENLKVCGKPYTPAPQEILAFMLERLWRWTSISDLSFWRKISTSGA